MTDGITSLSPVAIAGSRPDEEGVEQTNPESETSQSSYQNAAHQKSAMGQTYCHRGPAVGICHSTGAISKYPMTPVRHLARPVCVPIKTMSSISAAFPYTNRKPGGHIFRPQPRLFCNRPPPAETVYGRQRVVSPLPPIRHR